MHEIKKAFKNFLSTFKVTFGSLDSLEVLIGNCSSFYNYFAQCLKIPKATGYKILKTILDTLFSDQSIIWSRNNANTEMKL